MNNAIFRRLTALVLGGVLLCAPLAGCQTKPEPVQTTIFAMDTVMNLTIYGEQETLNQAVERIYLLQNALDPNQEDSITYDLNHAGGERVPVSTGASDLLGPSLELCAVTGGALDLTAYSAVQAWGFSTGEYRVPDQSELDELASRIDYTALELADSTVRLPEGMAVDFGAVAKGYAGDLLASQLTSAGVKHALLDLGQSSIHAIGAKPDGSPWRVGVQDPSGDRYLGVLELADRGMGTSGSYQRYFEADGVRYCHIIDPDTAAPAQSGLASVTVVSPSCLTCDGLSTALFVMGLEEGADFWRAHPELDFEAIFLTEDGSIAITAGLEDSFTLTEGYTDREVTVLS